MKLTGNELIDQHIESSMAEDEEVMLADGLENAFIGIGRQFGKPVAIYSYRKTIKTLMKQGKMDRESAIEYFDFNVGGSFIGDSTPVFLQD